MEITKLTFTDSSIWDILNIIHNLSERGECVAQVLEDNTTLSIVVPIAIEGKAKFNLPIELSLDEFYTAVDMDMEREFLEDIVMEQLYDLISIRLDDATVAVVILNDSKNFSESKFYKID
jgi:hypothetical protein